MGLFLCCPDAYAIRHCLLLHGCPCICTLSFIILASCTCCPLCICYSPLSFPSWTYCLYEYVLFFITLVYAHATHTCRCYPMVVALWTYCPHGYKQLTLYAAYYGYYVYSYIIMIEIAPLMASLSLIRVRFKFIMFWLELTQFV